MLLLKSIASYDRSIVPEPRGERSYLDATRTPSLSLRTRVLHPNTRIYVRLLGPCFKTGRWKPFRQHPYPADRTLTTSTSASPTAELCSPSQLTQQRARPTTKRPRNVGLIPTRRMTQGYNRKLTEASLPPSLTLSPPGENDADLPKVQDPHTTLVTTHVKLKITNARPQTAMVNITPSKTGFQRFPLSNFKYFLTLFSKFFSSFPHGTCSLSVSRQYLALDETYHPFRAALPSNSTLWKHVVRGEL